MKLTKNVIKLDCTKGAYAYAVICSDGVTLIDTCYPGKAGAILAELRKHKIFPASVKRILLTHNDYDNAGSAAELQEKTGCEIFIHPVEYPALMEGAKRDGIKRGLNAFLKVTPPKTVSRAERGTLGEFTVIPAPGHTRGHTVYRYRGVLFVGDLISVRKTKNGPIPMKMTRIMVWNPALALESIMMLPVKGAEWICAAHGEPVPANRWQGFINKLG
ncbi:MAG: MBL fold metallo-hydrolase [Clostridiales bacterium]|jgi:glyoxylase-like metal-dependent hydrolase (beta-lactamase superfamily II)|nr:MBL fold metallo-hydrolase [Clostridiales bacterium]